MYKEFIGKEELKRKARAYDEALEKAKRLYEKGTITESLSYVFPELKESESEDELTWLTKYIEEEAYSLSIDIRDDEDRIKLKKLQKALVWLEKQGDAPNYCHHNVDLSNCSEEYRKAYYDGWYNCDIQHSQCKSESNDVIKCLINGMKFYYDDNEETIWGTDKFSMKVKDIIAWLEKQGEKEITWNKEDEENVNNILYILNQLKDTSGYKEDDVVEKTINWLKSIKYRLCPDNDYNIVF